MSNIYKRQETVNIGMNYQKDNTPLTISKYEANGEGIEEIKLRMEELQAIAILAENPQDFHDEHQRIQLFSRLSYGLRKAGEALAKAAYLQKMAKVKKKEAEAIAALDDFYDYIDSQKALGKEIKNTDSNRTYFTQQSKKVLQASEYEAMMDAWVEAIATIKYELTQGISTLRAMAYGPRDTSYLSGTSDGKAN